MWNVREKKKVVRNSLGRGSIVARDISKRKGERERVIKIYKNN